MSVTVEIGEIGEIAINENEFEFGAKMYLSEKLGSYTVSQYLFYKILFFSDILTRPNLNSFHSDLTDPSDNGIEKLIDHKLHSNSSHSSDPLRALIRLYFRSIWDVVAASQTLDDLMLGDSLAVLLPWLVDWCSGLLMSSVEPYVRSAKRHSLSLPLASAHNVFDFGHPFSNLSIRLLNCSKSIAQT